MSNEEKLIKEAEHCAHEMLFWLNMPINEKNVKEGGSHIIELLKPRENRIAELEYKYESLKRQFELLIEDIKDCVNPNARYNVDDLIDDCNIKLENKNA